MKIENSEISLSQKLKLAQFIKITLSSIGYQSSFRFEPCSNITKEILDTINFISSEKKSQNLVSVTQTDIENYFEKIGVPNISQPKKLFRE